MIAALPRPVQRQAQARALLVSTLNPLGASITFGQVMYLLALHYGAGDLAMALLYASLNLTGLLAVLAPWLLAGLDTSTIQARAWFVRSVMSLGILGLPLLATDGIKVWALVGLVYLMMAARTIGVLANASVHKAICPGPELATFSARVHGRWNAGVLFTTVLCFLVLQYQGVFPSPEWAYMALMAFGVVFNFATALSMARMPPTGTVTAASPLATLGGFADVWRAPERREVLWLTLLQMPIGLAAAFQLNYLTYELGLPAGTVFLLTLAGVLASILALRLLAVIGDRISTRALWFALHAVLAATALAWCAVELLPLTARYGVCAVLWVLSAAALAGSTALYASMLSERLPAGDAVRCSAVYQVLGVIATVGGLALLGGLRWALDGLPGMHAYTHAFVLWGVLSLGVCAISLRLARGLAGVDLLAQLTPGNLSTIFRAHQLRTAEGQAGPAQALEREELLAEATPAGRALVLETLKSPDTWHRHAALRAVRAAPFAEAVPAVLAEAADVHSPLRVEAVTTLGFLSSTSAMPVLRILAEDADPWLAATAIKSLVRLGEPLPPAELVRRYAAAAAPREQAELLLALALRGCAAELDALLVAAMDAGTSQRWQDALALYAAQARGHREAMREILDAEDERPGSGLDEALAMGGTAPATGAVRQRAVRAALAALDARRAGLSER